MTDTAKHTHAPIESYAVIGDCETAALVSLDGSIDWLCWPDFSSDACFARLLGTEENGRWLIAPATEAEKTTRKYRAHTLILETTFETTDFAVMLIDFMPIRGTNSDIVRIVKGHSRKRTDEDGDGIALQLRKPGCPGLRGDMAAFAPLPGPTWWFFAPRRRLKAKGSRP